MASTDATILEQARVWRDAGRAVALATVVRTWGSAPRPAGSHLAVDADGAFVGSVSGGCIEGAVIAEAKAAIADGRPRLLEFGVSDEDAWKAGLACGGRIEVFVERLGEWPLRAAANAPAAVATRLSDGCQALITAEHQAGALALSPEQLDDVRRRLPGGECAPLAGDEGIFVRVYASPPRLLIVGAVHIAQVLAPMALLTGFAVTVIDPRRAFADAERFPGVELSAEWPDEALSRLAPDAGTAVTTLTHDPKLDDPALIAALRSPAFYIGALGSRRTHAARMERLAPQGLDTARIHGPIGLPLGGRAPAEIAVAILAEIIQVRCRRTTA